MLNVIKFNMMSFFHNGAKNMCFEILSTLARYSASDIFYSLQIFFFLSTTSGIQDYPITEYQNRKKLKNLFFFQTRQYV